MYERFRQFKTIDTYKLPNCVRSMLFKANIKDRYIKYLVSFEPKTDDEVINDLIFKRNK